MINLLETVMLICFGLSWPISVYKSYMTRTAKSTSAPFILLILVGYLAGIAAKIASQNYSYVLALYLVNLLMVVANLAVYFRNRRLDRAREEPYLQEETYHEKLHA